MNGTRQQSQSPLSPPRGERAGARGPWVGVLVLILTLVFANGALACSVCWGAPDDPMVKSVNKGIYVLLGIVGFVQIAFAALFYSFWRRAREQKRFRESLHVVHRFDEGGPLS